MSEPHRAEGDGAEPRRLADVDEWEVYEVAGAAGDTVVSLRPVPELRQVEYEVWDDLAADPRHRGSVAYQETGDAWATAPRAEVLRLILEDTTRDR